METARLHAPSEEKLTPVTRADRPSLPLFLDSGASTLPKSPLRVRSNSKSLSLQSFWGLLANSHLGVPIGQFCKVPKATKPVTLGMALLFTYRQVDVAGHLCFLCQLGKGWVSGGFEILGPPLETTVRYKHTGLLVETKEQ